ncbi:hypothetical protein ACFWHR_06790 [Leucobacter sp. NPDC058333]|uniref:hypothetical protein n=1 Tax=Leucobacter sp. NPDC058333 TaxID=3346450 RepID=UPI0036485871
MKFTNKLASAAALGVIAALAFGGAAAQAAEGDPITLAPAITLGATSFTVSGENCVNPTGAPGEVVAVLATDDPANPIMKTDFASADGTWSISLDAPSESGVYEVAAYCNLYADQFAYATSDLRVSKAAGVQLSVSEAKQLESFDFSGAGFAPNESVRVEFRQNGVLVESLGTVSASDVGEILGQITLGNTLALGAYDVVFIGEESGTELSAPLTITDGTGGGGNGGNLIDNSAATPVDPAAIARPASPGTLATTGGESFAPLATIGGVTALALGAGAVAVGRRKARAAR